MSRAYIIILLSAISIQAERTYLGKTILSGDCPKCKAGYYSDKLGSVKCKPCDEGTYASVSGHKKCLKCPIGTFMDHTAAVVCDKCKKGSYSDATGKTKCNLCEKGTYQEKSGQTSCDKCPIGTYMPSKGSDEKKDCIKCPEGNKCSSKGLPEPTDCDKGTQQDKTGQSSCKKCKAGTQNDLVEKTKCKECSAGTQGTKNGGVSAKDACTKCEPGTYNNATGESSCDKCPKNSFTNAKGSLKCTPCAKGQYTNGEGSTKCIPCAEGTSAQKTNKTEKRSITEKTPDLVFFKNLRSKVKNMDQTIIVDKSGSMNRENRWEEAKKAVKLLAPVVTEQDSNGISLYFFSNGYTKHENVKTSAEVMKQFNSNTPGGGTYLSKVLSSAFVPDTTGKPETILIITDGVPSSRTRLEKTILNYTKTMKNRSEMLISIVQVGDNESARDWLNGLEAKLKTKGAKFDIVDTCTAKQQKGQISLEKQIEDKLKVI